MKEDEAKTKWCPMARSSGFGVSRITRRGFDRGISGNEPPIEYSYEVGELKIVPIVAQSEKCIGSACMMWREHGPFHPNYKPQPHEVGGYCGLAGAP